jgi:hypothetical protein
MLTMQKLKIKIFLFKFIINKFIIKQLITFKSLRFTLLLKKKE